MPHRLKKIGVSLHYINAVESSGSRSFELLPIETPPNGVIENDLLSHWQYYISKICSIFKDNPSVQIQTSSLSIQSSAPWIYIVFVEQKFLSEQKFYDSISDWGIRPVVGPEMRQEPIKWHYKPVITISHEDISELGTQPNDLSTKKLLYSLKIDPRVKFLDSSIWHRYVPEFPDYNESFEHCIKETLVEMIENWNMGLYDLLPAVTTLEFQVRMLKYSYIGDFSNQKAGHAHLVTPFKFHSERHLKRRAEKESEFLSQTKWKNETLIENLNWRFLIVDDYAGKGLRTISGQNSKIDKAGLIMRPLKQMLNDVSKKKEKELFDIRYIEQTDNILKYSQNFLKKQVADIIFLDYLLGKGDNKGDREYGYELLLDLIENERVDLTESLQRDHFGRYWIFPSSSFPFALQDKLTQLGVGYLQSIWHVSNGGDPLCTPHLYTYYLMRFMKQRIGEYFLYPKALKHFFNLASVNESCNSLEDWAKLLKLYILNWQERFNWFYNANHNKNSSPFVKSITSFVQNQTELFDLLSDILDILKIAQQGPNRSRYNQDQELTELIATCVKKYPKYESALAALDAKISFLSNSESDVEKIIAKAIENEDTVLNISNLRIKKLYSNIAGAKHLRELNLSNNLLSEFPSEIIGLQNLEVLDLSHNEITTITIKTIKSIQNLKSISLWGCPVERDEAFINAIKRNSIKINKPDFCLHEIPRLFISYANASRKVLECFKKHVSSTLKQRYIIEIWDDEQIEHGEEWMHQISEKIDTSNVFIFLCDYNWEKSTFIQEYEVKRAEKKCKAKQASILPIFIEGDYWLDTDLKKYPFIPKNNHSFINLNSAPSEQDAWNLVFKTLDNFISDNFPKAAKNKNLLKLRN